VAERAAHGSGEIRPDYFYAEAKAGDSDIELGEGGRMGVASARESRLQ
jgi:hypothetical protein